MSYLFLLKRFEIWLLLGVVAALLVFAFQPVEEEIAGEEVISGSAVEVTLDPVVEEDEPEAGAEEPGAVIVQSVKVEPAEPGQVVEVTLLARSSSEDSIEVSEDTLTASTETGIPVSHFFAPFQQKEAVAPGEPSLVTVKFWLAESAKSIWLNFEGHRAEVELPGES